MNVQYDASRYANMLVIQENVISDCQMTPDVALSAQYWLR